MKNPHSNHTNSEISEVNSTKTPHSKINIEGLKQSIETFKNLPKNEVSSQLKKIKEQRTQAQVSDWTLILNHPQNVLIEDVNEELSRFAKKISENQESSSIDITAEIKNLGEGWYAQFNKLPQPLTAKQKLIVYHEFISFLVPKLNENDEYEQPHLKGNSYKIWRFFNSLELPLLHKMNLLNSMDYAFKNDEAQNTLKEVLLDYCVAQSKSEVEITALMQFYPLNQESFSNLIISQETILNQFLRLVQKGKSFEQAFALKALSDAISTKKLPPKFLPKVIGVIIADKSKWTDTAASQKLALLLAQTNSQKSTEALNLLLEEDEFLYNLLPNPKTPPSAKIFTQVLQSNFAVFQAFPEKDLISAIESKFSVKNSYEELFKELDTVELPLDFDAQLAAIDIAAEVSIPLIEDRVIELKDLEGETKLAVILRPVVSTNQNQLSWKMCLRYFSLINDRIMNEQLEVTFNLDLKSGDFKTIFNPDLKTINEVKSFHASIIEQLGMYAAKLYFVKAPTKIEEKFELNIPPQLPVTPVITPPENATLPNQDEEDTIPPTLPSPAVKDFAPERPANARTTELVLDITEGNKTQASDGSPDSDESSQLAPEEAAILEAHNVEITMKLTQTLGPSKQMLTKLLKGETEGVDFEKIILHQKVETHNEEGRKTTQYRRIFPDEIMDLYTSGAFSSPTAMENLYVWNKLPHVKPLGYKKVLSAGARAKVVGKAQVNALNLPAEIVSALMYETQNGIFEFYENKKPRLQFALQKLIPLYTNISKAIMKLWEKAPLGQGSQVWRVVRNTRSIEAEIAYENYLKDGFPPLGELRDDVAMSYPIKADAYYEKAPIKRVLSDAGEFLLEETTPRYSELDHQGNPVYLPSQPNEIPFILKTTRKDMNAHLAETMQGGTWVEQMLSTVRIELNKSLEEINKSNASADEKFTQIQKLEMQWIAAYTEGEKYRNTQSNWLDEWEENPLQEIESKIAEVKATASQDQAEKLEQLQTQKMKLKEIQAEIRARTQLITHNRKGEPEPNYVKLPLGRIATSITFNIGSFVPLNQLQEI